jgi:hypothetical protein
VFTARYELVPYIKQITFLLLKVNIIIHITLTTDEARKKLTIEMGKCKKSLGQ